MPTAPPDVIPAPTKPETVPLSFSGSRSATTVANPACMQFSDAPASTQQKELVQSACTSEEIISDVAPTSDPATIHGVRRPHRVRVRSENAPAIGVIVVLKIDVMANTIARLRALLAGSMA